MIRRLVKDVRAPFLALEHGEGQADAIEELVRAAGFTSVERIRDLAGSSACSSRGDDGRAGQRSARASPAAASRSSPRTRSTGSRATPTNADAVAKLYALKGRPPEKPAAVMFFDLAKLGDLAACSRGGVTLLLPNPERRFPLACTGIPETLGIRVPFLAPVGRPSCSPARTSRAARTRAASTRCRSRSATAPTSSSTAASSRASPRRSSTCAHPSGEIVRAGAVSAQQVEDAHVAVLHPGQ